LSLGEEFEWLWHNTGIRSTAVEGDRYSRSNIRTPLWRNPHSNSSAYITRTHTHKQKRLENKYPLLMF
jgi:hypothetical protein